MPGTHVAWTREYLMRQAEERPRTESRDDGDDRLTVRQAIVVWLVAAATGWLLTVGVVYVAVKVF